MGFDKDKQQVGATDVHMIPDHGEKMVTVVPEDPNATGTSP
jgi:hypothetical protein